MSVITSFITLLCPDRQMIKAARKPIPQATQVGILLESHRRCALCFHLHDDMAVKDGQLAHIDRNPSNGAEDNVVFLCLVHHNQYDLKPSQSKGWLPAELAKIKRRFQPAIADGRHLENRAGVITQGRKTDREMLAAFVQLMAESHTDRFLRGFDFGGQTFHWRELNALDDYVQNSEGAKHEFIDRTVESLRQEFLSTYKVFRLLLPQYTAPVPWTPTYRGVPQELRTTAPRRFNARVKRLRTAADQACAAYDALVRTAREMLAP
jgi:hypothetical protein